MINELSKDLAQFWADYDPYGYKDYLECMGIKFTMQKFIQGMRKDILNCPELVIEGLSEVDPDDDMYPLAQNIIKRIGELK